MAEKTKAEINLKFILFGLFAVLFPSLMPPVFIAPWSIALSGLGVGVLIISFTMEEEDRKFLFKIFVSCYLLRIFLAFLLYNITLFSSGSVGEKFHPGFFIDDGWGYSENGWIIANRLERGVTAYGDPLIVKTMSISGALDSYDYLNGIVYFLLGKNPLDLFFLNCFLGAITVVLIYFIAAAVFEKAVARRAAVLCAFWPSLILWSTQNLKEPISIFLVVLAIWAFISFLKRFNPVYPVIVLASITCLMGFRPFLAKIVAIAISMHMAFLGYRVIKRNPLPIFITILMLLFIIFAFSDKIINFLNPMQTGKSGLSNIIFEINNARRIRAYANLAILPGYNILDARGLLLYFPIGLAAVLLGPFPWQLFSASQIMAAPEMLVWYVMFPCLIKGLLFSIRNKLHYLFSMLAVTVFTVILLSLVEGNIGTIFRHRAIVMNFLLVLMAVGMIEGRKQNEKRM